METETRIVYKNLLSKIFKITGAELVYLSPWLTLNHMVDLESLMLCLYGNDLENHMVDVDDAIGKRCMNSAYTCCKFIINENLAH
jgi:ribosome biogenesis protein Nip4